MRAILLAITFLSVAIAPSSAQSSRPDTPALPIRFEPSGPSAYRTRGSHQAIDLTPGAVTLRGSAGAVRMTFPGAGPVAPESDDPHPSVASYFLGSDPGAWRTNIPAYSQVRYRNLYPGIDLVFHGAAGRIEYDFIAAPGADPSRIRIVLQGADRIAVSPDGDLVIGAQAVSHKPVVYQSSASGRRSVAGAYRLQNGAVRFRLGSYDRSLPLIIDPVLTYATLFGGSGAEAAYAMATDSSGNVYLAGSTSSTDLTAGGHFGGGKTDAFVAKFGPTGSLLYATYLGGIGDDVAYALAVDSQGNAYVTGGTNSANYPATPGAYSGSLSGPSDAFVAKLNAAGTSLLYASYLGGSGSETGYGIAVDSVGDMFVTGSTSSSDYPVSTGAYDRTYGGGAADAFVTALAPSGILYSTYLGGSDDDQAYAIALDGAGNAYVAGKTLSANFPATSGAIQTTAQGLTDGFVTAVNATGTALLYSTYLGGSDHDYASGIALDPSGAVYVAGLTASANFPHTAGVIQQAKAAGSDAFVAKISPSGSDLLYSTFVGGSGADVALSVAVDAGGIAYATGSTTSTDFPVTADALQKTATGEYSAFIAVLNSDASALLYGTYLSGSGPQTAWGIGLTPAHDFIAAGYTGSADFPVTAGAYQSALSGSTDAFMARFSALPVPALSVAKSHTGNFTKGQTGATYSVLVSNSAAAGPTSGSVTVTETMPLGLTLKSLSGQGWTCPTGGVTCTRADSLAAGASYSAITVTADVSLNAASQVTNQVSVAGGGSPGATALDVTSISLASQTITFAGLSDRAYSPAGFGLSATATSGLTVSFASLTTGVCTVAGSTVTMVALGTCTIEATQSGNTSYAAATAVDRSFSVTQAPQTITFASLSDRTYGSGTFVLSATATSGLTVSFTSLTTGVCTVAGSTVTLVAIGACTIEATQAGTTNYAAATAVDQTFSVTRAPSLHISKTHTGNFSQGQVGATYSVTVGNASDAGPTSSMVTVTELPPAGLKLMSMSGGAVWDCTALPSCTTSTVLSPGSTYPAITVVVNVAGDAPASLQNGASVSGGNSPTATAADTTTVAQFSACDINRDWITDVTDAQRLINEALGVIAAVHDLTGDGVVNDADVLVVIKAVLGLGCSPSI